MTFGALFRSRRMSRRPGVGRGGRVACLVLCGACIVTVSGMAQAQSTPEPASGPVTTEKVAAVSGNPAAATFSTGSGWLGRTLGLRDEWGVRLGGVWLADTNGVVAGGVQRGAWTADSALLVGLGIDADKLVSWKGASFGFQFLQVNGGNTNGEAGSI